MKEIKYHMKEIPQDCNFEVSLHFENCEEHVMHVMVNTDDQLVHEVSNLLEAGFSLSNYEKCSSDEIVALVKQERKTLSWSVHFEIFIVKNIKEKTFVIVNRKKTGAYCICGNPVDYSNADCIEFNLCKDHADDV
jgi:hypothetical protein